MKKMLFSRFHYILIIGILFSAFGTAFVDIQTSYAAVQYIKPSAEIPIRRGQGSDYKIVAIVTYGAMVEIIQENAEWTKVRLKNGKEGWTLKRYLTSSPPLDKQVEVLQQEKKDLADKTTELQFRLDEVILANSQIEQDLTACIGERDAITEKYATLERDTADVVQTNKALDEAQFTIDDLNSQLATIQIENAVLKKSDSIKWFLVGSGVLLTGWFLGRFARRPSKKRRSLL